jgi:predicted DNA-binding transcriptional regulator AlpA
LKPDDSLISTTEIARRLGVTNETVVRWGNDPDNSFPPPVLKGSNGRTYRWKRAAVEAWLAEQEAAADVA